jgi:hypothetical protein
MNLREKIDVQINPDLVIGVMTGGAEVVATMIEHGGSWHACGYISASRPSSTVKKARFAGMISHLPRKINNLLRGMEHLVRLSSFRKKRVVSARNIELSIELLDLINMANRICVVDDAIDSGSSLLQISNAIYKIKPEAVIYTAVIVQTFPQPVLIPDITLFQDVLVRFPWAIDAR